jgi:GNAT superfamily N-acetyltransferase
MSFFESEPKALTALIHTYHHTLTAPFDDMWTLGIIPAGKHYAIQGDQGHSVGYFVVDEENMLLQFYLDPIFRSKARSFLHALIGTLHLKGAYVGTNDPAAQIPLLEESTHTEVHTKLYRSCDPASSKCPALPNTPYALTGATLDQLSDILRYTRDAVGDAEDMADYTKQLIESRGLFLIHNKGAIIGTGEIRQDPFDASYLHVGVTVAKLFRNTGIGSHILSEMRAIASKSGKIALCSTESTNFSAQKAIEKSGFYAHHLILELRF